MSRVRLRYRVRGKVRFLSNRDVARVTERAIRAAGVPVAYSEGFSPRPRLHFGLALATGYESDAEYLELDLDPTRDGVSDPAGIASAMAARLPEGVELTAAAEVDPSEPSLQDAVTSTAWSAVVAGDPDELGRRAGELLASSSHPIEIVRKGKQVREDLRPLLLDLSVQPASDAVAAGGSTEPIAPRALLHFELGTKPRSVRPAELLATLGVPEPLAVRRTHQWIQRGTERSEPLGPDPAPPHATDACATRGRHDDRRTTCGGPPGLP